MNAMKTFTAGAVALALSFSVAKAADIVETTVAAGSFNTLVTAVKAAGLVDTLKGPGPFTVFAPTDEAFAKLAGGTVENLLKPENKQQLVAILTYHVVPGKVMSKDLLGKKPMVKTVEGTQVSIDATDGVRVNDAKVVKADIEASNGVIHVIDTVIIPKE
jgi:uncharacterized surface protein with fasciclin (FAS1) repeats